MLNERVLTHALLIIILLGLSVPAKSDSSCNDFSLDPGNSRIAPGGAITFIAAPNSKCTLPNDLSWKTIPDLSNTKAAEFRNESTTGELILGGFEAVKAAVSDGSLPRNIDVTVSSSSAKKIATSRIVITLEPPGDVVIPVIGFEQTGASSAQSSQKFFFSFFISRPLPFGRGGAAKETEYRNLDFGSPYDWWGDVRIASYPQQITTGVGEFAAGFATQVAQLKVNQIAQAGEFNTGIAVRVAKGRGLYPIATSSGSQRAALSVVAGFGATSPLNPATSQTAQLFVTPPAGSPQRAPFLNAYPSSANYPYTGFTVPNRGQFFWEYGAGVRLMNLFFDKSGVESGTPLMVTYSLGQNQAVTGGHSKGVVQRIEGFFPLVLGNRFDKKVTTLYLFGRADMSLAAPKQVAPFILQPAPTTVNAYDSDVNIISVGSNRDIYTIGVGVDAVKLIKSITAKASASGDTAKTVPVAQ